MQKYEIIYSKAPVCQTKGLLFHFGGINLGTIQRRFGNMIKGIKKQGLGLGDFVPVGTQVSQKIMKNHWKGFAS